MNNFNWIENGSVTSTPGFKACGVTAGLKKSGKADMALIVSDVPANFAGVFTSCVFAAAPVQVNRRIVPLSCQLQTGDFVEVMTSSSSHGPSRDWLNIVKTSEAKAKIRAWLKKEQRDENIIRGRELLEREAKRMGYSMSQLNKPELVETLYKRYSVQSYDDVCAMVGFGGLSTLQVLNRLIDEYKKTQKPEDAAPPLPFP